MDADIGRPIAARPNDVIGGGIDANLPVRRAAGLSLTLPLNGSPATAQSGESAQRPGHSAEEGPMEGVLVSARRAGSTITITVASDEQDVQLPRGQARAGPVHAAHPLPSDTISTA
jgi:hypothetical protein